MFQQVSLALGVAFAATILEVTGWFTGDALTVQHFHIAFLIVSFISLAAILPLLRLSADSGAAVSGHKQPAE